MRDQSKRVGRKRTLLLVLAIAFLLFTFGFVAQQVTEGTSLALDRRVILALRDPANSSALRGPAWLQETARNITSLGSIIVLAIITFAVAGYLFLARNHVAAWLMLIAVFGGIVLNDLLKFAFARPRPDFITHADQVFTASFPSGHAALSAITYLTIAALLARSQTSFKIRVYFVSLASI